MKEKSGFTLVEIMIVVAIIALLAGLAVPSVIKQRSTARKTICINNLRQIDSAKEQYALAANLNTDSEITAEGIDSYIKGGTIGTQVNGGTNNAPIAWWGWRCSQREPVLDSVVESDQTRLWLRQQAP